MRAAAGTSVARPVDSGDPGGYVSRVVSRGYRLVRALARALLKTQYRRVEVVGAERMPATGPLVVVANHWSSLVDSLAILRACPREVSPLAKAPLFGNRLLRPFLVAAGAVPVHRAEDGPEGRGMRAHAAMLDACRRRLAEGGALIIFPEGVSQPRPKLMPLRAGAAHVALGLEAPVRIVPIGLVYEPPASRRGTLLVRFGEPFEVDGRAAGPRRPAAIALTRRIEESLRALLAEAESQGDLDALRTLETIFAQERGLGAGATLESHHGLLQRLARGLSDLRRIQPAVVDEIRAETDAFRRELSLAGIPLDVVDEAYSTGKVARFALLHAALLLLLAPIAICAAVLTWPVRALGDVLFMRLGRATEDVWTLHRMAGEAAILLVSSLLVAALLALFWSPWAGLLGLVAIPMLFAFQLLWRDWREHVRMHVRAFLLLAGGAMRRDLRHRRRALFERVLVAAKLLEDYNRAGGT